MVFLITISIGILTVAEISRLIKKKQYKESTVYFLIIILSLFYIYEDIFEWNIPDLADYISRLFHPLSNLVFGPHEPLMA